MARVITVEANPFIADHVIGGNPVLPTVCATGWMASACVGLNPGYVFAGYDNYRLFKGVVFDGSEAPEYRMDIELVSDSVAERRFKVSVWSTNAKGMRANHYGAEICLVSKAGVAPHYHGDASRRNPSAGSELYANGTLFHGPRFQGIREVLNHSAERLTLACVAPVLAVVEQGQFPVGVCNAFVDDLMFQAMLVWARLYHQAGSLPSGAKGLRQYAVIPPGSEFLLSLEVSSHNASSLVADIVLHDGQGKVYSRMLAGEVTISKSLDKLFVPKH